MFVNARFLKTLLTLLRVQMSVSGTLFLAKKQSLTFLNTPVQFSLATKETMRTSLIADPKISNQSRSYYTR